MARVRLKIDGNVGSISIHTFLSATENELRILQDLDSAISRAPGGTLDWLVTDLSLGSLVIELDSRSRLEDKNIGLDVANVFAKGLHQIEEEGTTPPYYSEYTLQKAKALLRLIGRDGAVGLHVSSPGFSADLTARASANIGELIPVRHESLGSVEGTIEMISIHGSPRFVIYHSRTRKAVSCRFDSARWLSQIKDALGRRVYVTGVLHTNVRGEPLRVHMEDMVFLRQEEELPTPSEIRGIDPHLTGDVSTSDYLRSVRGE